MTDEFKIYRVNGYFVKPQLKKKINITMDVRANKISDVLEKVYSEVGSRHRVKRSEIFIAKKGGIVEIDATEARDPIYSDVEAEDFEI